MKSNNIIAEKSYAFAVEIVSLCKELKADREFEFSSQLLRSGTSIGANIEEAIGGQSRKDFFAKITISYKEARESKYWLRLLRDSSILEEKKANHLIGKCDEILRILTATQKTTKQNNY